VSTRNSHSFHISTRSRMCFSWQSTLNNSRSSQFPRAANRSKEDFEGLETEIPLDIPVMELSPPCRDGIDCASAGDEARCSYSTSHAALTDTETEHLFKVNQLLKARGVVSSISPPLEEVLKVTDRITVLRDGKLVGTVATREATWTF